MGTHRHKTYPTWIGLLIAIFIWGEAVLLTIFFSALGIVFVLPFSLIFESKRRKWMHGVAVAWAKLIMAFIPIWKTSIQGRENIRKDKVYVIIANHQSLLDILVLLAKLPVHFKFLAKQELFSIPFIGWHMKYAGYIPIVRSSKESGKMAVDRAKELLKEGVSVLFFPEGTRSQDGTIKEFKVGAFKLARELKAEILPVVIDGTGDVMPKDTLRMMRSSNFHLHVEKPVSTDRVSEVEPVKELVRHKMIQRLDEIRTR